MPPVTRSQQCFAVLNSQANKLTRRRPAQRLGLPERLLQALPGLVQVASRSILAPVAQRRGA